jgi:hypothetical protein
MEAMVPFGRTACEGTGELLMRSTTQRETPGSESHRDSTEIFCSNQAHERALNAYTLLQYKLL